MKNLLTFLNKNLVAIILIACVVVGTSYIKDISANTDLEDYIEQVDQFAVVVGGLLDYTDSLKTRFAELEQENVKLLQHDTILTSQVDSLNEEIVVLQPKLDSLQAIVDTISYIPEPVQDYIIELVTQNTTLTDAASASERLVGNLRSQIFTVTIQRDIQQTRADSLEIVIQQFPFDVPDNEHIWGVIPLPSRTTSFFVGAAVATLGTVVIIG